jgi:Zn-dependent protease
MENNYDLYPEKPVLVKEKVKSNWGLTLFSIIIFIASFLIFFTNQINFVFFLIFVLFFHEIGHFLLMKKFKYENVRMLFIPLMGAFVQGSKERYSQRESLLVVLAGPIPGVVVGCITIVIASQYQLQWALTLSFIFLFLNTINLLPLDPLDGGQLFKLLVHRQRDFFMMLFALGSSLLMIVVGLLLNDWLVIIFGFFMGIRVRGMQQNYQLRKELEELEVNYFSTYDELSNRDYAMIKGLLMERNKTLRKYASISEDDISQVIASHVNGLLIAPIIKDASWRMKIILICFWVFAFIVPFLLFLNLDFNWYFENI